MARLGLLAKELHESQLILSTHRQSRSTFLLVRLSFLIDANDHGVDECPCVILIRKNQHGPSLRKHSRDVWLMWPTYQQHNPHGVLVGMILTQFFS